MLHQKLKSWNKYLNIWQFYHTKKCHYQFHSTDTNLLIEKSALKDINRRSTRTFKNFRHKSDRNKTIKHDTNALNFNSTQGHNFLNSRDTITCVMFNFMYNNAVIGVVGSLTCTTLPHRPTSFLQSARNSYTLLLSIDYFCLSLCWLS